MMIITYNHTHNINSNNKREVRFIQGKFGNSKKARTVEDISKVFAKLLVFQGKLSAAVKLLDSFFALA